MLLDQILGGWELIFNWQSLVFVLAGVLVGTLIGAIPGLTITMAMAIFVPFTFFMPPIQGIPFLLGLYKGGTYGGSISAILIGIPGTGSNVATVLDGYPLTQQGQGGRALGAALYSSLVGDLFGTGLLVLVAPLIAGLALLFSPADYTGLILFAVISVACMSGGSMPRAWLAICLGFFVGVIGLDIVTGGPRFTFGNFELQGGISVVTLGIGLFGVSSMLLEIEGGAKKLLAAQRRIAGVIGGSFRALEIFKHIPLVIKSSTQGIFLGSLFALGAPIAIWTAYYSARARAKAPEKFGKGAIEGVIAPETANNSVCGAAMIPMMVFGIPGDVPTAILIGAFIAQGLRPSPLLFQNQPETIYALFIGMYFATIALFAVGKLGIPLFIRAITLRKSILYPIVLLFCLAGSYAIRNSLVDVSAMLVFGVIGYFARKLEIPLGPTAIGVILGGIIERNFRSAVVMSGGSLTIFLTEPISAGFIGASLLLLGGTFWLRYRRKVVVSRVLED